jgi:predicted MFS family arabinose efflux permease
MSARALGAAVGATVAGVLPVFLAASLTQRMKADFAFGASALGLAVAVFHAVSAIVAPWLGRLVGRIGATRTLRLSCATTVVCSLAVAVLADSAAVLIGLLALCGIANGGASPAASALLRATVAPRRRGVAFGAQLAGAPLGVLVAGLALPLVAAPLGWRWAYVAAALIAASAAMVAPAVAAVRPASASPAPPTVPPLAESVYVIALAAACANAAGTGVLAFLVTFCIDSGIDEQPAALLLSGVSLAAVLGRVGIGLSVDRRGADALATAIPLLVAGAVGAALLAPAEPVLIVGGALVVACLGWSWPGLFTLAAVAASPDAPARAVGVMMAGLFAGAVAGPLLVGALASEGSYEAAWLACAALSLVAAGVVQAARSSAVKLEVAELS